MNKKNYLLIFIVVSLIMTGCATVQTAQEWAEVKALTVERTGIEPRWEQTEDDAKSIKAEVDKLLSGGLTEDKATRIALLNNRKLQSEFEEIGIAKADLIQAGLFTNPDLAGIFRFPFEGGVTNIEATGLFKISDLWQLPLRRKVAAARLQTVMFRILEEILNTAADAKHAHNEYIALSRLRHETGNMKKQGEELRDHLIYRHKFGLERDIDITMASADVLNSQAEFARIEKDLQAARMRLSRVLGLSPEQYNYEIVGTLPKQSGQLPDRKTLLDYAFSMRPDLQMAKGQVEEARRILVLERKRFLKDVETGFDYEHDTDGTDLLGPEVKIQAPIFDQNQAQIAKAEFKLRQAEKELQNKMNVIREEVLAASEKISLAGKEIELVKDHILPVRKSAVDYAEEYVDSMQLNRLYLFEARKKLLETDRRLLEARRDLRNQEIEFERISGGAMPLSESKKDPAE